MIILKQYPLFMISNPISSVIVNAYMNDITKLLPNSDQLSDPIVWKQTTKYFWMCLKCLLLIMSHHFGGPGNYRVTNCHLCGTFFFLSRCPIYIWHKRKVSILTREISFPPIYSIIFRLQALRKHILSFPNEYISCNQDCIQRFMV